MIPGAKGEYRLQWLPAALASAFALTPSIPGI
jgi:hypothetical protein